jgi:hypothetical protein
MKKSLLLVVFFILFISFSKAQTSFFQQKRTSPYLFVGGSINLSSVNIFRNYSENPYHLGWSFRSSYLTENNLRFSLEYFRTPSFQLAPTWKNVSSNNLVLSLNALAHIVDQDVMIYTVSGICFQSWKGFYTGQNDFSDARFFYTENSWVRNKNICLDLGIGFEKPFPGFNLYGDFRYRFAEIDNRFGIIDAFYQLGVSFPVYPKSDIKSKHNNKKRGFLNKLTDKYKWF